MLPDDLAAYSTVSDPNLHPDGVRIAFVVTRMDLGEDRYERRLWLWDGEQARPFTTGPGDARPRWSPDGERLVFQRAGSGDKAVPQVAVMPAAGGEAEVITSFPLGATEAEWSPDGSRLAVVGVSWTDEWDDLDEDERGRRPRRVSRAGYRHDNLGWRHDRRSNVYLVDPAGGSEPAAVSEGEYHDAGVVWRPDGEAIAFMSARHERRGIDPGSQVWEVPASGGDLRPLCDVGLWYDVSYRPDGVCFAIGVPDPGDYPGVLALHRLDDGAAVPVASHLDRSVFSQAPAIAPAGPQWLDGGACLIIVEDAGRLRVVRIEPDGSTSDVLAGDRLITGMSPTRDGTAFAFAATSPTDPGALFWYDGVAEHRLTESSEPWIEPVAFTVERDGVAIDAWAFLPDGEEQVPLLLNIHGGPATQYGYGFFDEFQVYAAAGYGVVACNPRGSSGKGTAFVRAPVDAWEEERPVDLEDLLAVVDAALDRFRRLDRSRMGIMGGSYGGFMTAKILTVDDRWRSAVPERGLYSFTSFAGTSDIGHWFPSMYLTGWDYEEGWDRLWRAGPLSQAHRITTPCLIVHSEHDWRCPIEQAEQLFSVLAACGVEVEMLRFPGEGHELSRGGKPKHRKERFEAILDWHARHLRDVTT